MMGQLEEIDTAVIVPTLGTRPEFLSECLASIREAGRCLVVLVRPDDSAIDAAAEQLVDQQVVDPRRGLAAAINAGLAALPATVRYATWLGDDDRLTIGSLTTARARLELDRSVLVFGGCRYIDDRGEQLWLNSSGRWAVPLMRFGPQLLPQPGSLFDRRLVDSMGGLDESLKWAFDLDLFLRLAGRGRVSFIATTLAEFRWHDGSLSVGGREGSVREASAIRRRFLPRPLRPISVLWEPLMRQLILLAGRRMNRRLRRTTAGGSPS